MPTEEEIQEMLDHIKLLEVQALLRILALNFTEKTRIIPAPNDAPSWRIAEPPDEEARKRHLPYLITMIKPVDLFGVRVGYDSRLDVLVIWQSKKGE